METTRKAVNDYPGGIGVTENEVIDQTTEGEHKGQSFRGDLPVFQDETEMHRERTNSEAGVIEVKFNAGSIVFAIGLLGTLVWSFIGNIGSELNSAPLYHALTNEAIASANGFAAISPVAALIAICIYGSVVGGVFGLVVVRLLERRQFFDAGRSGKATLGQ